MADQSVASLVERLAVIARYLKGADVAVITPPKGPRTDVQETLREAASRLSSPEGTRGDFQPHPDGPMWWRKLLQLDGPVGQGERVGAFLRQYAAMLRRNHPWDVPETMARCFEVIATWAEGLSSPSSPSSAPAATPANDPRFCDEHQGMFALKPDGACLVCALMRHGQDESKLWAEIDRLKKEASPRVSAAERPAQTCDWSKLSRIEVIDESGRIFSAWDKHVEPSIQDDGRTLKLFINFRLLPGPVAQEKEKDDKS